MNKMYKNSNESKNSGSLPSESDTHDHGVAAQTAAWLAVLMADWCDAVREPRRTGPIEALPGFRLAALVARYAQRVFDTRTSLLNDERADEYRRRSRDPAPSVASLVRPRPAVSVAWCAAADAVDVAAAVPALLVTLPPLKSRITKLKL